MRRIEWMVGIGLLVAGMATALYVSLHGPGDAASPAPAGGEAAERASPMAGRSDATPGNADREDPASFPSDEPIEIALTLPWTFAADASEVVAWIERDLSGRVLPAALGASELPGSRALPAIMGERQVVRPERRRAHVWVDSRARAVVIVDGDSRARWVLQNGRVDSVTSSIQRPGQGESIRVRVRDTSGRLLLGVPVGILRQDGPLLASGGRDVATGLPDGIAVVRIPVRSWRDTGSPEYWVAIRALTARPVVVPLPPPSEREDVVELTLPPHGRLEVEIVGDDGKPVPSWAWASLAIDLPWSPATGDVVFPSAAAVDGRAVFGVVPADVPLTVKVVGGDDRYAALQDDVRVGAGATRSVRVAVGRKRSRVTGRVVGAVPAGAEVFLRIASATAQVWADGATDPEPGAFDIALDGHMEPELPFSFDIHATTRSPSDGRVFRGTTRIAIDDWPPSGVIDAGEIRMEVRPVVVTGRVREPDGAPVCGAYVRVEWQAENGEWRRSSLSGSSGADGAFVVRGATPPGPLRLVLAGGSEESGGIVEFDAGERGVAVTAAAQVGIGYVMASVRLPAGLTTAKIWMRVWRDGADAPDERPLFSSHRLAARVAPGRWSVDLGLPGSDEPIASASGVVVKLNQTVRPPDLQRIDVALDVRVTTLRITDPDGEPAPVAKAWWRTSGTPHSGPGASYWTEARPGPGGLLRIARQAGDALDVIATSRGLGWGATAGVTDEGVVRLTRLQQRVLRVRVGNSLSAIDADTVIRVSLVRLTPDAEGTGHVRDVTDPRGRSEAKAVRAGDVVELDVQADGTYGVQVGLSRRDSTGNGARGVTLAGVRGVATFDTAIADADVIVAPSPGDIADALARLDDALRGQ